jgi:hypothetical protein
MQIMIVMPVFEDWECAALLCAAIDECLAASPEIAATVLIVDDGSSRPAPDNFPDYDLKAIRSVCLLRFAGTLAINAPSLWRLLTCSRSCRPMPS